MSKRSVNDELKRLYLLLACCNISEPQPKQITGSLTAESEAMIMSILYYYN